MRRGTAEISSASIPDPHFQKDTIESTQNSLEKDFNSLYQLAQVSATKLQPYMNCEMVGCFNRMTGNMYFLMNYVERNY